MRLTEKCVANQEDDKRFSYQLFPVYLTNSHRSRLSAPDSHNSWDYDKMS